MRFIFQEWCSTDEETDNRYAVSSGGRKRGEFYPVSPAGRFALVNNPGFGTHTVELLRPAGLARSAFTFTSCLDFSIAGAATGVPTRS
jgi:hypothetical protein